MAQKHYAEACGEALGWPSTAPTNADSSIVKLEALTQHCKYEQNLSLQQASQQTPQQASQQVPQQPSYQPYSQPVPQQQVPHQAPQQVSQQHPFSLKVSHQQPPYFYPSTTGIATNPNREYNLFQARLQRCRQLQSDAQFNSKATHEEQKMVQNICRDTELALSSLQSQARDESLALEERIAIQKQILHVFGQQHEVVSEHDRAQCYDLRCKIQQLETQLQQLLMQHSTV